PRAQIDVVLVDAGKLHGMEELPADRVTVRHEGRDRSEGRARTGLLRRFRS
ncbi:MAG: hypothetical protein HOV96_40140, partial [Nonomuraea sp.]|nr:hypothetical protein [Nonomuraea sp.]